jgi:hypothetical protein
MESTEEYKELLSTLESIQPEEWLNIPEPVTNFLSHIKQLVIHQSQLFISTNDHISKVSESLNDKILNVKKKITPVEDIDKMIEVKCNAVAEDLTIKSVLVSNRIEQKLSSMTYDIDKKIRDEGLHTTSKLQIVDSNCKSRVSSANETLERSKILLKEEVEQSVVPRVVDSLLGQITKKLDK